MKLESIEHIAIAVKDLNVSIKFYEEFFGLKCYAVEVVNDQKVRTAFFKVGQTKIELLEATESNSSISKFIEKHGEGIHHLAFSVSNLSKTLNEADSKGIQLIDKEPRKGAEGFNIAFLHPKSLFGVLTELCEKP
jgi:methylmalonyl-CoA/ethylmalonyl-CoA epimerase